MKVLIINRYMGLYGGAETAAKELSLNLRQMGAEAIILTLNITDNVRHLCAEVTVLLLESSSHTLIAAPVLSPAL